MSDTVRALLILWPPESSSQIARQALRPELFYQTVDWRGSRLVDLEGTGKCESLFIKSFNPKRYLRVSGFCERNQSWTSVWAMPCTVVWGRPSSLLIFPIPTWSFCGKRENDVKSPADGFYAHNKTSGFFLIVSNCLLDCGNLVGKFRDVNKKISYINLDKPEPNMLCNSSAT